MRLPLFICLLLTLCTGACSDYDYLVKETRNNQEKNFYTALAIGYREIARWEREQFDWNDADYFAKKGVRALSREDVEPDDPRLREIPNDKHLSELLYAREKLINILDNEAKMDFPLQSSHLQILYESWVEQTEEDWQEVQITRLREEFYHKLEQLREDKRLSKRLQSKPAETKNFYTIYFDNGSGEIDYMAKKEINKIVYYLRSLPKYQLILEGHTDYLGSPKPEMDLSEARVKAVKTEFIKLGVAPTNFIREKYLGSKERRLIKPDNKSDRVNRRVEIYILQGVK